MSTGEDPTNSDALAPEWLTRSDVLRLTQKKKTWLHEQVRTKRAPAPVRLSHKCAVWLRADVDAWLADPVGWAERNQARAERGAA